MKRKVQAQRKFAQGAYIPQSTNERRTEISNVKEITDEKKGAKDVIYSKMTPTQLLDMVSFENIHIHDVRVLVKRLEDFEGGDKYVDVPDNGGELLVPIAEKQLTPVPKTPDKVEKPEKTKTRKSPRMAAANKFKKSFKSSNQVVTNGKALSKKRPTQLTKAISKKNKNNVVTKRNKSPIMSEFSTDDDTPLNQINKCKSPTKITVRPALKSVTNFRKSKKNFKSNTRKRAASGIVTRQISQAIVEKIKPTSSDKVMKPKKIVVLPTRTLRKTISKNTFIRRSGARRAAVNGIKDNTENKIKKTPPKDVVDMSNNPKETTLDKSLAQDDTLPHMTVPKITNVKSIRHRLENSIPETPTDDVESSTKSLQGSLDFKSIDIVPTTAADTNCDASLLHSSINLSDSKDEMNVDAILTIPKQDNVSSRMQNNDFSLEAVSSYGEKRSNRSTTYYGRHEIEKWMVDTTIMRVRSSHRSRSPVVSIASEEVDYVFKVPEPRNRKLAKKNASQAAQDMPENLPITVGYSSDSRASSPCPSSFYTLTNSVLQMSESDQNVNSAMETNSSAQKATKRKRENDVYAFDETESVSASDRPAFTDFRKNKRKSQISQMTRRNSSKDSEISDASLTTGTEDRPATPNGTEDKTSENDSVILNMTLGNSAHTIQLISNKVANQPKNAIKMRLIPQPNDTEGRAGNVQEMTITDTDQIISAIQTLMNNASDKQPKKVEKPPTPERRVLKLPPGLLEAPTFEPTEEEFKDPLLYIKKISLSASAYGVCKIVPPKGFQPECHIDDTKHFRVTNQYPAKMFHRWGPAARELCAIKQHSGTQQVKFTRSPLINGLEVNLPKLYHIVQRMGGLKKVIEKRKWQKVAEEMNYPKGNLADKRLDSIYVKYLLPYDTLTNGERQNIFTQVEKEWNLRYKRMLERAQNPLRKQRQVLGESSSEDEDDDDDVSTALAEADDCVVFGRNMNLTTFKKIAATAMNMHFSHLSHNPSPDEVEDKYWQLVVMGNEHVCVNSAALDTGENGYGFTKNKADPYAKHPWNPKVLSNSPSSVLRSLGPVLCVTVPTLHLGMVFSTSCWHRDPHGLPWIEYLHEGPPKIWYGISDEQTDKFRRAVETLCPAFCRNKSIWLASDITMIPPKLLVEHNLSLSKVVQNPGEFIIVFPKAYSSSICTGYCVSESVCYGPQSWLATVQNDFREARDSCEPTMFSVEQLLTGVAQDLRVPPSVLSLVQPALKKLVHDELEHRRLLQAHALPVKEDKHPPKKKNVSWNVRELNECEICRSTLYLSKVSGLTEKKSAYCLQHALRLLERKVPKKPETSLVCYYSDQALNNIVTRLNQRLQPDRATVGVGSSTST